MNRSPSSRQLKKYKFFLPVEIYLLAVFMQLASKFRVFPLALKFRDSFASVYCLVHPLLEYLIVDFILSLRQMRSTRLSFTSIP